MIRVLFNRILEFLFPTYCLACTKRGSLLCSRCRKDLSPTLPECYICRKISNRYTSHTKCLKPNSLSYLFIFWQYNKTAKTLLKQYKYSRVLDIRSLFIDLMNQLLSSRAKSVQFLHNSIMIPVPISKQRSNQRGFNQAQQIGESFAEFKKIRFIPDLIIRDRDTARQSGLDKDKRIENLKDAFKFNTKYTHLISKIKWIYIFDDVITTGSTMEEIAKSIRSVKPDVRIYGVALFRGKDPKKRAVKTI